MLLAARPRFYELILRRTYTLTKISPFLVPAISTLRPKKLLLSDFLVFADDSHPSFHTRKSFRIRQAHPKHSTVLGYRAYEVGGSDSTKQDEELEARGAVTTASERFPKDAQGFLYLHQALPRSACSIRFRCVPSLAERYSLYGSTVAHSEPFSLPHSPTDKNIHKAFETGYDLALPDGTPWSIPVIFVAGCPSLKHLRMQILDDETLSESELWEYEEIYNEKTNNIRARTFLDALDAVFPVKFGDGKFLENIFFDPRRKYGGRAPYTGAGYARFELAPGGDPDRLKVHVRIVEIIKPVKCVISRYDGYIHMPTEGEFITHALADRAKPWVRRLSPERRSAIMRLVPSFVAKKN